MITVTHSRDETKELGRKLAKKLASGGVLCLYGDLGAGKTTLVQGLAAGLGVKDRIISPTFILVRRYSIPAGKFFYHVDLYRLNSPEELAGIGLSELWSEPGNVVAIEWPAKAAATLPKKRTEVYLETVGENERKVISNFKL